MATQIADPAVDGSVEVAVEMFRLLGEPTRLRIAWALLHGEHSVNNLAEHVGVLPAAASQHLAKLRLARLVKTRREGTHVFYAIDDDHVRALVEAALSHVAHQGHSGAGVASPTARRAL